MKQSRLALIVGFYLLANLYFIGASLVARQSLFDLLGSIALPAVASTACLVDSYVIGRPLSLSTRWMTIFYWPVTVPFYLIWSRGWRGFGLLAMLVLIQFGCFILAAIVADVILLLMR